MITEEGDGEMEARERRSVQRERGWNERGLLLLTGDRRVRITAGIGCGGATERMGEVFSVRMAWEMCARFVAAAESMANVAEPEPDRSTTHLTLNARLNSSSATFPHGSSGE